MISKQWILFGAISGFFSVVFGAFGAHALKNSLSEKALSIFHTGVHYQMVHSLALIALGIWTFQNPALDSQMAGWAFTLGILLFSGSLYALALTGIGFLGAITPIGVLSFLLGWAGFTLLAWRA